jgi:hypothetical protein
MRTSTMHSIFNVVENILEDIHWERAGHGGVTLR